MNWESIENSERYKSYDQKQKNFAKAYWFKKYVTPSKEFQAYPDERKMNVLAGFFSEPLPEEPGYAKVVAKSTIRGFENLAGGVGSLMRWTGDVLDYSDLEKAGKKASKYFREAAQEGWEAPDPRIYGGTFWENPSVKRAFGIVGEAAPSYVAALAASVVGGSPAWGAGILGLLEGAPQAEQAMEAGLSTSETAFVGVASTLGTALLEYLPVSRLLKRKGGALTGALVGGTEESVQEVTQQVWQNLIAKLGYDETTSLADGIIESAIGGFGTGAPAGGVMSSINKSRAAANEKLKAIAEAALRKGVSPPILDAAVEDIQNQLKNLTEDDVKAAMAEYGKDKTPEEYPDYTDEIQAQIDKRDKETLRKKALEEDLSYKKRVVNQEFLNKEEADRLYREESDPLLKVRKSNQQKIDQVTEAANREIESNDAARAQLAKETEQRRLDFIEKDSVKPWDETDRQLAKQIELDYGKGYEIDSERIKKMVSDRKFWNNEANRFGIDPVFPGSQKNEKPKTPTEKLTDAIDSIIEEKLTARGVKPVVPEIPTQGETQKIVKPVIPPVKEKVAEKPVGENLPMKLGIMEQAGIRVEQRKKRAKEISDESGEKSVVLTINDGTRGVIIHPSTKKAGQYQLTRWDKRGFSGDSTFKTKQEAVEDALSENYEKINPAAFDEISRSRPFRKYPEAVKLIRDYWEGGKKSDTVIELPAEPAKGAAKQPWEMTRDEFSGIKPQWIKSIKSQSFKDWANNKKINVPDVDYGKLIGMTLINSKTKSTKGKWKSEIKKYGEATKLYNQYVKETKDVKEETIPNAIQLKVLHKRAIRKALSEGKPVPEPVLADYPELTSKPKKPSKPSDLRKAELAKELKEVSDRLVNGKESIPTEAHKQEMLRKINDFFKDDGKPKKAKRPSLKNQKGENEIIADLASYGADLIRAGHNTYSKFRAEMKRQFGEVWDKIKKYIRRIFNRAVKLSKEIASDIRTMPPPGTLGIMGGVNSKMADMTALERAKSLESSGFNDTGIRKETGWFRGYDNKWRFEIDDSKAKWKTPWEDIKEGKIYDAKKTGIGEYNLSEILDHPSLFENYPGLKTIKVQKKGSLLFGLHGSFNPETKVIHIVSFLDSKNAMETLLHELQHWVQYKEDFASGGNTRTSEIFDTLPVLERHYKRIVKEAAAVLPHLKKAVPFSKRWPIKYEAEYAEKNLELVKELKTKESEFKKISSELDDLLKKKEKTKNNLENFDNSLEKAKAEADKIYKEMEKLKSERARFRFNSEEYNKLTYEYNKKSDQWRVLNSKAHSIRMQQHDVWMELHGSKSELNKQIDDLKAKQVLIELPFENIKFDSYKLLSGELEARDVSARKELTKKQRIERPPYTSEDIAYDETIVTFDNGESLQSGAWKEPLNKYREFTKDNPDASKTEIQKATGLSAYQVDTIATVKDVQGAPDILGKPKYIKEKFGYRHEKTKHIKDIGGQIFEHLKNNNVGEAVQSLSGTKSERTIALDKAKTFFLDKLHPIKVLLGEKPYKLFRGLTGTSLTFGTFLEHGELIREGDAYTIKSKNKGFKNLLKELGEDSEKFLYWLVAKRSKILSQPTEEFPNGRERLLTEREREETFAWAGGEFNPKMEAAAKRLKELNDNIIGITTSSGLIDEKFGKWLKENLYYVPFFRVFEDEVTRQEFVASPHKKKYIDAQIKKLKGSKKKLGDPLENILANWEHLISESMRNIATAEAYKFAEFGGMIQKLTKTDKKNLPNVLRFQKDGIPVYFKVNDESLFNALSNINTDQFDNAIIKVMAKTKKWLTYGATFGPAFRVANALRDTIHSALIKKEFTPFIDTWKGAVQEWTQSSDSIAFAASGFSFGSRYIQEGDVSKKARHLRHLIKTEKKGVLNRILDTPAKMLDFWDRIGAVSEVAARLQLYSNLMNAKDADGNKIYSHLDASFEGRDLLDFTLSGASKEVQTLIQIIPFLNARMQGLSKVASAAKDPANRKNIMLRGSMLMGAAISLWALYKDDDRYKELEDWDKWSYAHFWIGDNHFRIPSPFETGAAFMSFPVTVLDTLYGNNDTKHIANFIAHTFTQTFSLDVPQLFKPMIEQWANKSFFTGRPIVGKGLENLEPSQQKEPWTSESMQLLGKALGVSPKRLEALVNGYFSSVGMLILGATDMIAENAAGFPESPTMPISDYPLIGRFLKRGPSRYSKQQSWFYETLAEINKTVKTINNYKQSGDMKGAIKLATDRKSQIKLKKQFNKVRGRLSNINKRIRRIWLSESMDAKEKSERIESLVIKRNALIKRIYNRYSEEL